MGGTEARHRADGYRASHLEKGDEYDAAIESAAFDAYLACVERDLLLRLVPRLFPTGVERYLDFACGTGRITAVVAQFARESIGVDVSASMVARAREKCPATKFVMRDITVDPIGLQAFDLVTAFRFFGNAEPELRYSALRAIGELLAPGGYLVLNNHRNAASTHNRLLRLRKRSDGADLTLPMLTELLRASGFEVVSVIAIGAWLLRYRWCRRSILESSWAHRLERLSRLPGVAGLSPDMIVVARRQESRGAVRDDR